MNKRHKLLSLLLSVGIVASVFPSSGTGATSDSIAFYNSKKSILEMKEYDEAYDTNHNGVVNVFDVIRENKEVFQEESYTDLKAQIHSLETQIEILTQKLTEKEDRTQAESDLSIINSVLSGKIDQQEGKQLSSNDYTDEDKNKLGSLENYDDNNIKTEISSINSELLSVKDAVSGKVEQQEGKQLSSNDYTNSDKEKLESLENYDDTKINQKIDSLVQTAYEEKEEIESSILSKVDKEEGKSLSSNDYTDEDKRKLENLENFDDSKIYEEINEIKNELLYYSQNFYEYKEIAQEYHNGYYDVENNYEFVSTDAFRCVTISVCCEQKIRITAYIGGSPSTALAIFLDSNNKLIDIIGKASNTQYNDFEIVVPDGCSKVLITSNYNNGSNPLRVETLQLKDDFNNTFKNKWVSILGDSISTYTGCVPAQYEGNVYYNGNVANVTSVNDTWWKKTIDALDLKLLVNNSGGGSTVSGDSKYKFSNEVRSKQGLQKTINGVNIQPDIIIVEGGVNDFSYGINLGTYNGTQEMPVYPQTTFRESYAITLNNIRTEFPNAEVYCCTLFVGDNIEYGNITKNGSILLADYNKAIREIADLFGCKVIDFALCGINPFTKSAYTNDDGSGYADFHPNEKGMSLMANEAIKVIEPSCNIRYKIDDE